MPIPSEIFLFGFLIIIALMVAVQSNLFAAAMLTGVFSLLSACLFTLMDAVDVAFTEAAVGAGISTVLVLGTLALTDREERQQGPRLFPFVVVILTGIVLMIGTLDMEPYGSPKAPIHTHVAAKIVKVEYEQLVRNNSKTPVNADEKHPKAVGLEPCHPILEVIEATTPWEKLGSFSRPVWTSCPARGSSARPKPLPRGESSRR